MYRTVIDMPTIPTVANDHEASSREGGFTATVEEVIALDAGERQRLLTQLRRGGSGPKVIVQVPQLVRMLGTRSEQGPRFDLGR